mgnify:CR=1 FL=1
MNDVVTLGVIGLGNAGAPILNNLYKSNKYKLVAFDIDTAALDIDSSGAITIDGTSTFSIDAVGASNVTTNGVLTISGSTGLNLASDGGEIDVTARQGNIDINATAGNITVDSGLSTLDDFTKANFVNFEAKREDLYRLSMDIEAYAVKNYDPLLATFETEALYKYVQKRYTEILKKIPHAWVIGGFDAVSYTHLTLPTKRIV